MSDEIRHLQLERDAWQHQAEKLEELLTNCRATALRQIDAFRARVEQAEVELADTKSQLDKMLETQSDLDAQLEAEKRKYAWRTSTLEMIAGDLVALADSMPSAAISNPKLVKILDAAREVLQK